MNESRRTRSSGSYISQGRQLLLRLAAAIIEEEIRRGPAARAGNRRQI